MPGGCIITKLGASYWEDKTRHGREFLEGLIMKAVAFFVALFTLTAGPFYSVSAQETKIKWFGHAAFSITTPGGRVLLIDPWLGNPSNPEAKESKDTLATLPKVDCILLTHGHRDHVGDAVEIARKTGAVLISNPELAGNLVKLSDFPSRQAETDAIMGIGGEVQIADGEVAAAMTPAVHSSSVFNPRAGAAEAEGAYGGNTAGFVVTIKNGPTIYHSDETISFRGKQMVQKK
jgi:L-ascorbate metabolism protein UlaG (beta-lactamase superfamily)